MRAEFNRKPEKLMYCGSYFYIIEDRHPNFAQAKKGGEEIVKAGRPAKGE